MQVPKTSCNDIAQSCVHLIEGSHRLCDLSVVGNSNPLIARHAVLPCPDSSAQTAILTMETNQNSATLPSCCIAPALNHLFAVTAPLVFSHMLQHWRAPVHLYKTSEGFNPQCQ